MRRNQKQTLKSQTENTPKTDLDNRGFSARAYHTSMHTR